MHGNAHEWCQDLYGKYGGEKFDPFSMDFGERLKAGKPPGRVLRGGSFSSHSRYVRSAFRNSNQPELGKDGYGFRAARTYSESP